MPRMLSISVITPSYNHAEFLGRTIESVHSQRGEFRLEHIVVDGGSTDGTVEILESSAHPIRWVSEPDDGQADALNKGLAMATGDVVGWLNSDDVYEPGALAEVAGVLAAEPETRWAYGKVRIIDRDDREIRRWITAYKNWKMRRFSFRRLLAENWISQMGVFWRRRAGEEVGPFRKDLHYCMDYDFWLRLAERWPGRFLPRYLAAFRWYAESKSGAGFSRQFREQYEVARKAARGRYLWTLIVHRLNVWKIVTAYRILGLLPGRRALT
jgi:glycosyltransferase involved in cell wall biosynthesis